MAFSSDMAALYAIPVRRASVLPAASFRFSLATDTLAVRLMVPAVGSIEDFHLQVGVPCRAHHIHKELVSKEIPTPCHLAPPWCSGRTPALPYPP